MRWKSNKQNRREKLNQWHPIFTFLPRRMDETWVWLEYIQGRKVYETVYVGNFVFSSYWEFRLTAADFAEKGASR